LGTKHKKEGGLGIINLKCQNNAPLLKNLHNFFNKANCPWVDLIWNNYYPNGTLPDRQTKRIFLVESCSKRLTTFKGIPMVKVENGSTVFLWHDLWANRVRIHESVELFSFFLSNKIFLYLKLTDA
jgi:hypothetical protein